VLLTALHGLAAREREGSVGENCDPADVTRRREDRERPGEEVVARRLCGVLPVLRPSRGSSTPDRGAVDEVVVHERRHVHELYGDACRERR
jgi:hypothetical protein